MGLILVLFDFFVQYYVSVCSLFEVASDVISGTVKEEVRRDVYAEFSNSGRKLVIDFRGSHGPRYVGHGIYCKRNNRT